MKLGLLVLALTSTKVFAQQTAVPVNTESSKAETTQASAGVVYQRPTVGSLGSSTAIGGYMDGNLNYFSTDGLSEGTSLEMRHFNLFVYSTISPRISLMSEIEFEHGSEEISIETAQLDWRVLDNLTFRGGIVLAPLGGFNQRHDAPLYEFIDRPLVSTTILPATLSLMALGAHGKLWLSDAISLKLEGYITNPIGDHIINNEEQRTNVAAGKSNELYEESLNGAPAVVGRVAINWNRQFELGLSAYNGVYNRFRSEANIVDLKRSLTMMALDLSAELGGVHLQGECALNQIELPEGTSPFYGSSQWGMYLEAVTPLAHFATADYAAMQLNLALRVEDVDYNVGNFENGSTKFDDDKALSLALALRPTATSSIRLVGQRHWMRDILGNESNSVGIQFGFATYF